MKKRMYEILEEMSVINSIDSKSAIETEENIIQLELLREEYNIIKDSLYTCK